MIYYELTNEQRRCFALDTVKDNWTKTELKAGPYDDFQTFAYIDGNRICKIIAVGKETYREFSVNECLSDDGIYVIPKTEKGKPKKLSSSVALKFTQTGMSLAYERDYIGVWNISAAQCFYSGFINELNLKCIDDFIVWVNKWCTETTEKELADIEAFSKRTRQRKKYAEGDFFRFRINRHLFGYGRLVLSYPQMKKEKIPHWQAFMGQPLCVGIYHIVTERADVSISELESLMMLPPKMILDNALYYGEFEIIGNKPITEKIDYPIHYGKSYDAREHRICYQCGKTFKYLENTEELFKTDYRNTAIGYYLHIRLSVLNECINQKSNTPYWEQKNQVWVMQDLRNPRLQKEKKQVEKQFGINL